MSSRHQIELAEDLRQALKEAEGKKIVTVSQTHIRALLKKLEQFPELEAENRGLKAELDDIRSGKEIQAHKKEIKRLKTNLHYYKKRYGTPYKDMMKRKE